ncbi:MarR family transcriptional regulator [Pirellulales bacterium]|nr:MarR family transcriptional regulator [Pirellulales bacterium]
MNTAANKSDSPLLDHLRQQGDASVSELGQHLGVTATAIRQRLARLMDGGLVARSAVVEGRGRPSHRYRLTAAGVQSGGNNYDDLAMVLWEEVRAIEHPEIRRGLLARIAGRLMELYRSQVVGGSLLERMKSLAGLLAERDVPVVAEGSEEKPVLTVLSCPYPELAEQDRSICAMERKLFADVLGEPVRLTGCRLDGETCCTFELSSTPRGEAAAAVS